MPELPDAKRQRFVSEYGLRESDADVLTVSRPVADYFEATAKTTAADARIAANWVVGDLTGALNRDGIDIDSAPVTAAALAGLLDRVADETISGKIAKEVFDAMWAGEGDADAIIEARGLRQITDTGAIDGHR